MGRRRRGRAWPRGGSRPAALVAFGGEERTGREEGRREKRLVGREGKGTCVILALPYVLHLNASNAYIKGRREYMLFFGKEYRTRYHCRATCPARACDCARA
jgi:hypothetical protein